MNGKPRTYLINTHPDIFQELDSFKNQNIDFKRIGTHSNIKIWWICKSLNHSFNATPNLRVRAPGCPICSNRKVLSGFNDLRTFYPELSKDWDAKHNFLTPEEICYKSNQKFWWLCENMHSEYRTISSRINSPKCKECSSLYFLNPKWMQEWNWEKNNKENLDPKKLTIGSNAKVWWICKKAHSWKVKPNKRKRGDNCPYCGNKKILPGFNDLASRFPQLMDEWDFEKNYPKIPIETFPGNVEKVWWICKRNKEHKWKDSPNKRTSSLRGCSKCSISVVELELFEELKKYFPLTINHYLVNVDNFRVKNHINVDFYLPEQKSIIEYDGRRWHESEEITKLDIEKTNILLEKGYKVIRLRDRDLKFLEITNKNLTQIQYAYGTKKAMDETIDIILNILK